MPQNLEAEIGVLGCMLLDNNTINLVTEILDPDDFYAAQNQWVFKCIMELSSSGSPVDTITLSESLQKENIFDKIGGYTFLTKLLESVISTNNVAHYCHIIKDKAIRRKLITNLGAIIDKCYLDKEDIGDIMESAEKSIYDISLNRNTSDFTPLPSALETTIKELNELSKNLDSITGVPTGFNDLDNATAGLQKGDFILLAARPSMGKTALAVNIAQNASIRHNRSVAVFSLEMSTSALSKRIISAESEVNSEKIRVGKQNTNEWKKITKTFSNIKTQNTKMFIDDTSSISINELRSKCRKLKTTQGLDLIVIDYLQLMTVSGKIENRQQEISAISRALKGIAKELDCPVLALSQLSRAPEARTNKRPMLSDLRESGAIEQDADIVMLLYRDKYYNPESEDDSTEVIIAKNRNGSTQTAKLTFHGKYTKFVPEEMDLREIQQI